MDLLTQFEEPMNTERDVLPSRDGYAASASVVSEENRPRRCSPRHEPTPDEIERACSEIQKEWSDKERRKRSGLTKTFWLGKASRASRVWM
ncbi:MAG: hypothetical protein IT428_11515 [Planctomycetaceae bacterium]|nr:hypothetical protein [Planctomycetaceae bacterium]